MFMVLNAADWTHQYGNFGEQTFLGITMSLVGMVIVMLILALISTIVGVMSWLIVRQIRKSLQAGSLTPASSLPAASRPAQSAQLPAPTSETGELTATDPALVAVIAAALACMLETTPATPTSAGFIIRKVRRV